MTKIVEGDGLISYERKSDGYINATEFCKAHRKRIDNFLELTSTQKYISFLIQTQNIESPILTKQGRGGGTWIHPLLAIRLDTWVLNLSEKIKNGYYVYLAYDDTDRLVYIGSGSKKRHQHLTSGVSSSYQANKYYFSQKKLRVEIDLFFDTRKEALIKELVLIRELKPDWNITGKSHRKTLGV